MAAGDSLHTFIPPAGSPPAANYATFKARNIHPVYEFDADTDETIYFEDVLNRAYSGGNGIDVTLFILADTATSGASRWQVAFERHLASTLDLDGDSFATDQSGGVTAPATAGMVVTLVINFTNSEIDGLLVGESFRLRVVRDANGTSGTDDMTGDAHLLGVELKQAA